MLNDTNPIYLWTMARLPLPLSIYTLCIFANMYNSASLRIASAHRILPRAANILTSFIAHIPPNYMPFVVVFISVPSYCTQTRLYLLRICYLSLELRHGVYMLSSSLHIRTYHRRNIYVLYIPLTKCPHIIIIVIPVGKCGLYSRSLSIIFGIFYMQYNLQNALNVLRRMAGGNGVDRCVRPVHLRSIETCKFIMFTVKLIGHAMRAIQLRLIRVAEFAKFFFSIAHDLNIAYDTVYHALCKCSHLVKATRVRISY